MNLVTAVTAKLLRHPHIRYTATETSISVEPVDESGFTVGVSIDAGHYTVNFDGWHEEFPTAEAALDCFAFGLSDSARLGVTYRGDTPTKWVLESRDGERWVPDSETGLVLIPFWRSARVVYRQNRFITDAAR